MPYRNERLALEAQREELQQELTAVESRLASLSARRSLLDSVRIASPCHMSWDGMTGDDRVRFCHACEKNVYNLSAMTRDEAERLWRQLEGRMCARLFQRADGTVITSDCAIGERARRSRRITLAVAVGTGVLPRQVVDAA
jgi:hypothetical protein